MGLLWTIINRVLHNPFCRHTYKQLYIDVARRVEPFLVNKYGFLMEERKKFYSTNQLEHHRSNVIWFCWLQGLHQAPEIVKVCYTSLLHHLKDRDIIVIDGTNWKEYVSLPDYIVKKWGKAHIPPALFSDLLRLQLLIRYGGTWIDSTVLCTGFCSENEQETHAYLNADLFLFQYTEPCSNKWRGISNWFITACTNNEVLMVLRDILFAYWKDYDCTLYYYIFHLFFGELRKVYPKDIATMPYGYSRFSIALSHHWGERFNKQKWDRFTSKVCFHKLSYNISNKVRNDKSNYYNYIVHCLPDTQSGKTKVYAPLI